VNAAIASNVSMVARSPPHPAHRWAGQGQFCRKHAAERRACDPTYSHLEASGVRVVRAIHPITPSTSAFSPSAAPPAEATPRWRLRPQRSVGYRAGDRLRDRADPATLSRSLFAVEVLLTSEPRQAIRAECFAKPESPWCARQTPAFHCCIRGCGCIRRTAFPTPSHWEGHS